MNKVLLSVLALALVGALAGGGLFAYFSDTETSIGNTFEAGTIDISLTGDLGPGPNGMVHRTVDTIDFKPCETGFLVFTITNDGENEADVWKLIDGVECWENWPSDQGDPTRNNIDTVTQFGMWEEGGDVRPDPTTPTDYHYCNVDDRPIVTEGEGWFVSTVKGLYIYLGTLTSGASMTIVQTFHMDGDTGNWAQGDQMMFNETFVAQQTGGNPPPGPPGLELAGHGKP